MSNATLDLPPNATLVTTYVTEGYLMALFKRSDVCLELWRKNRGLPYVVIPGDGRPAVRFKLSDVLKWAKRNNIETHDVPDDLDTGRNLKGR